MARITRKSSRRDGGAGVLLMTQSLCEAEPLLHCRRGLADTSRMRRRLSFMAAIATIALSLAVTAQSRWFGVP
jgi:hypothetical protein